MGFNEDLLQVISDYPEANEMASVGNDSGVAAYLNAKTQRGLVPIAEVELWALLNGLLPRVFAIAQDLNNPLWGIAFTINRFLSNDRFENLDMQLPEVEQMIGALVTSELLTVEKKDELLALTENRQSIAEKFLGRHVTVDEVSNALSVNRPDGRIQ